MVTTKEEGHTLRREIQHLQDRLVKVENEIEQEKAYLSEMIERARTDVEKLEETLNRATRVLARNSADYGADLYTIKDKMRQVDGILAELRHEVETTGNQLESTNKKIVEFAVAAGIDIPVDPSTVPTDAKAHFKMIKLSFSNERYGEVRSLAKIFLKRHSRNVAADDVQLLLAKSYMEQKRWAKALGVLRQFTDRYKKSELTPEVLYQMARSFLYLGDCTDARILVEAVTTRHKRSPFAGKALELSKEIKKSKSRCTS